MSCPHLAMSCQQLSAFQHGSALSAPSPGFWAPALGATACALVSLPCKHHHHHTHGTAWHGSPRCPPQLQQMQTPGISPSSLPGTHPALLGCDFAGWRSQGPGFPQGSCCSYSRGRKTQFGVWGPSSTCLPPAPMASTPQRGYPKILGGIVGQLKPARFRPVGSHCKKSSPRASSWWEGRGEVQGPGSVGAAEKGWVQEEGAVFSYRYCW